MTVLRMDHVGVVVEDIEAAKAFFVELGLEVEGTGSVEGEWVDRIVGLEGVRSEIVMMATPDGHSKLELTKFQTPAGSDGDVGAPSNALGLRHLTFAVDELEPVLERLRERHGADLVGEVADAGSYLLCYLRGPEGIIVELAEAVG